jgi:hypothetical protein
VTLKRVVFDAAETARIMAAGNLSIEGAQDAEPVFDPDFVETAAPAKASLVQGGSEVRLKALGDATLDRVALRAPKIRVTSERVLKMTAVQINDGSARRTGSPAVAGTLAGPSGSSETSAPSVYLFGKDLADLRRVNFFANEVLIQSKTISLESVRFRDGSRVLLESAIGVLASNPNTGAPVEAGKVNFVRDVKYGATDAQNAVIQNGPAPTPSGPGIVIRPYRGRLPN